MHLDYIWAAKAGRTTCRGLGELANGIALLLTSAPPACRPPRASSSGLEVKRSRSMRDADPQPAGSRACVELAPSGICAVRVFVWRRYLGLWLELKRRSPSLSSSSNTPSRSPPNLITRHLGVCPSGHSCSGVCSGRGLRAVWPGSLGAPSVLLSSW